MSKAEKTKQHIIEKTATLFNTKGYISTSLSDITQATGLTKGSIYGNFENKDEVAIEVYKYNAGLLSKTLSRSFGDEFSSSPDKLHAFVDFYRKNWPVVFSNGGCPLMNAATEADDSFPALKKQVKNSFQLWIDKVSSVIRQGQKNKEISEKIDAGQYASTFIMLIEGGILLSKTMGDQSFLNHALDRISYMIDHELNIHPS
ncbi:TetR/AcrR family transcriptional regulator [Chryseobacterium arthrosphaerae]|uniref:TetR/AcrR family transcriptional regulator n=1 Tax=Chryseobacterium arthrosphaerae TaxID=651561 RepID=A0ABU7QTE1_9FLAO|nr:TetR/AcrR family transcriptional regulator [Chryseobacterium arthrosphaerae]AYZ14627.1 TetR/AcrR family transcriptional regulator [Chryseobacterium arthrosphaerae]QUY55480.1 TetR/AcrR family transcriptional regulator [Chryseobacterium arthrosphaerae]UEQ75372.1 TetR/AcrR family transcriptional regulator [Chryseobacterium arthrosphaerae]WES96670.1 TetR/AcrR family transcriptional regulator [Chryseobacterium arthrosphaerae]